MSKAIWSTFVSRMLETSFAVLGKLFSPLSLAHRRAHFPAFFRRLRCHRSCYRASSPLQFWLGCIFLDSLILASSAPAQGPATVGQWSAVTSWPYTAIHAHVLPNGKVMWWTGFALADNSTLWDPSTGNNTPLAKAGANIFCSGHAFLPDGTLLVAGGHVSDYVGIPNTSKYDPFSGSWTRLPDMNNARWYPTNTTLATGDVLVTSGWIDTQTGVNVEPQVWQVATSSWRNLTAAHLALPFYPFMFVAPNGKVFCAGPSQTSRYLDPSGSGTWSVVANKQLRRAELGLCRDV